MAGQGGSRGQRVKRDNLSIWFCWGRPERAGFVLAAAIGLYNLYIESCDMRLRVVPRFCFIGLFAMTLALSVTPAARAASFYWYGENDSTCWQAGRLGASSFSCDSVGAGYLSSHLLNSGGIAGDIEDLSISGDYCSYYELGDTLVDQDSNNEEGSTGYETPTPYGSYQESDAHQNVCQASGANWGQEVRASAPGNKCYAVTCGMHHYVSFESQGLNDRPWGSPFYSPSLIISGEANPQIFGTSSKNVGGWGYLCPILEDITTGDILEYCLQEWRSQYNTSEWAESDRTATCASDGHNNIDTIITMFNPGTKFATERAGSANTFVLGSPGRRYFTAAITPADLQAAISKDNEHCGRPSSTNPANYALIGVEQGAEGWRDISELGDSTANLQLSTEYTPLPPTVTTGAATNIGPTQATLNGSVDPNWSDTHYYYRYGTSLSSLDSYAPSETGNDAGSELTEEEPITVGLEPARRYYYQLVAYNSTGEETRGRIETFVTLGSSMPAIVREASTGYQWEFYRGSDGALWEWANTGSGWQNARVGGQVARGTSPVVVHEGSNWWFFYQGSNGELWEIALVGSKWETPVPTGDHMAPGASPAVVHEGSNWWFFYQGSNGELWEHALVGSKWETPVPTGDHMAPGASPAVVHEGSNWWFFYQGSNGELWEHALVGSKWETPVPTGDHMAPGASPAVVHEGSNWWFFYQGSNGELWEHALVGSKWETPVPVGDHMAPGTTPTIVREGSNWWFFYQGSNGELWEHALVGSKWEIPVPVGGHMGADTDPAVVIEQGDLWVYFQDEEGAIWQESLSGSTWAPFYQLRLDSYGCFNACVCA